MAYSSQLYQQVILDHNRNPRNFKELEHPTHSCQGHNPLCGDNVTVYLHMDAGDAVDQVSFTGSGCAISKASASMMTEFVRGKSEVEIREVFREFHNMVKGEVGGHGADTRLGKLTLFQGVREYPARVKCATLAWHALIGAMEKRGSTSTENEGVNGKKSPAELGKPVQKEPVAEMDLSGVKCPLNFVKVKVRLADLEVGDRLRVILDDGDPIRNVPRSLELEGQKVLSISDHGVRQKVLVVEKAR